MKRLSRELRLILDWRWLLVLQEIPGVLVFVAICLASSIAWIMGFSFAATLIGCCAASILISGIVVDLVSNKDPTWHFNSIFLPGSWVVGLIYQVLIFAVNRVIGVIAIMLVITAFAQRLRGKSS
ncbi:MAG: hypothetical protein MUD10_01130 [Candidatus Pacebacteria bacterium]|jgi:hypothetical protein|nr:hypothetical protein [Candidatus Paceibacterota bacterium]